MENKSIGVRGRKPLPEGSAKVLVSVRLPPHLLEKLDKYCAKFGDNRSEAIAKSIKFYLSDSDFFIIV
jgi:hypothetical protein